MSHIRSVTEITQALRDVLEAEFAFVWVRGQVTNLSRPSSGHIYFTLADAAAALPVVWFRGSQGPGAKSGACATAERIDPRTGEVLEPGRDPAAELSDGQEVLVAGRVTLYAPRGACQLVAELVQPSGVSDLALAFEALKRRLAARGLFDEARKRPVPPSPLRVALVTSPQGAAVRDFLRLASERGPGVELRIYPTLVQGAAAPAQIASALDAANADGWAQVAALIRGGGSLEDLWAFNDEAVAEAVARSATPVVTGIGHEPDVTIADYVADRRYPTPSAVAAGLWPLRADLMQQVDGLEAALVRAMGARLERDAARLEQLRRGLAWLSPAERLARLEESWAEASRRLVRAGQGALDGRRRALADSLRDFFRSFGPEALDFRRAEVEALAARAVAALDGRLERSGRQAEVLAARLAGLNPEGPLARGYSLVRVERTGRLLRSAAEVGPGDRLGVRTADGEVSAVVAAGAEGDRP